MSYHSKIYFKTQSDRKSNQSFGCNEYAKIELFVGRSKNNKHRAANIYVTCDEREDHFRYELKINGEIINVVTLDKGSNQFSEHPDQIPNYEQKKNLYLV
tara:strand:- start:405 stop:704 length:300 start_codon:yes stop_codon:yes gene_type:complete